MELAKIDDILHKRDDNEVWLYNLESLCMCVCFQNNGWVFHWVLGIVRIQCVSFVVRVYNHINAYDNLP